MPRREVYLSSLTAGRCFTVAPGEASSETQPPQQPGDKARLQQGRAMMSAQNAYKVVAPHGDEVLVENALGEQSELGGRTLVVEIPREGFERLAASPS